MIVQLQIIHLLNFQCNIPLMHSPLASEFFVAFAFL